MSPTTELGLVSSFEAYIDTFFQPTEGGTTCTGCLRGEAIAYDGVANRYCEPCLRYSYGYDQAEEKMIRSMVSAAISAARDSGAPLNVIARAVYDGMRQALADDGCRLRAQMADCPLCQR